MDQGWLSSRKHYKYFVVELPAHEALLGNIYTYCPQASILGYFDLYHLPLRPVSSMDSRIDWKLRHGRIRWLTGDNGDRLWRFPGRGFYSHNTETAHTIALSVCDEIWRLHNKGHTIGVFAANLPPRMDYNWSIDKWDGDNPTNMGLYIDGKVVTYKSLCDIYPLATDTFLSSLRQNLPGGPLDTSCLVPPRPIIMVGSNMRWSRIPMARQGRDGDKDPVKAIDGRLVDTRASGGSFVGDGARLKAVSINGSQGLRIVTKPELFSPDIIFFEDESWGDPLPEEV